MTAVLLVVGIGVAAAFVYAFLALSILVTKEVLDIVDLLTDGL